MYNGKLGYTTQGITPYVTKANKAFQEKLDRYKL